MFIAALFTIAKMRKQPKCPSTDKGIKKIQCIYIYMHIYIIYTWNTTQPLKRMKFNTDGLGGYYAK